MTRWEAAQIMKIPYDHEFLFGRWLMGVRERNMSRSKLAERYKAVMLANHPDRGGSPYLALKINEAKRVLEPFMRMK